jgi:hypothetical protein
MDQDRDRLATQAELQEFISNIEGPFNKNRQLEESKDLRFRIDEVLAKYRYDIIDKLTAEDIKNSTRTALNKWKEELRNTAINLDEFKFEIDVVILGGKLKIIASQDLIYMADGNLPIKFYIDLNLVDVTIKHLEYIRKKYATEEPTGIA